MNAPGNQQDTIYEAPRALRLGGADAGAGTCETPGSADYTCQPSGTGGCLHCETGTSASSECTGDGLSATAYGCQDNGESPTFCYSGGIGFTS